mmetsp:Transcript_61887/g.100080  ORF Transcript_61887/g.100080 Transcript_61887/m.100080 type:complete len:205 (+) Transcript_61887:415-1029(+)
MEIVRPGGSKEAWLSQATGERTGFPSASIEDITHCDVRIFPKASVAPLLTVLPSTCATFRALDFLLAKRSLDSFWAMRVPAAWHLSTSVCVGRNLTRMGSKTTGKPLSLSLNWSSSTASPLQPKDPKTPQGFLLPGSMPSTTPRASFTCVGISPPSVGLPMQKPSQDSKATATSLAVVNSRFMSTTRTPEVARPLEICAARFFV